MNLFALWIVWDFYYCFFWAYHVAEYPGVPFWLTQVYIVIPAVSVVDPLAENLCKMDGIPRDEKYSLDIERGSSLVCLG